MGEGGSWVWERGNGVTGVGPRGREYEGILIYSAVQVRVGTMIRVLLVMINFHIGIFLASLCFAFLGTGGCESGLGAARSENAAIGERAWHLEKA